MPSTLDIRPQTVNALTLAELATQLGGTVHGGHGETVVRGISLDSKQLRPGDVFAALAGKLRHGAEFATQAESAGALAILTDEQGLATVRDQGSTLAVITVERPRHSAALAAELIYARGKTLPTRFGVTGTNGKTMTIYLLDELAKLLGKRTAISSTAERRIGDETLVGGLTTPESTELHALMGVMAEQAVDWALIEVSAQAFTHQRLLGQQFTVMSFLNLSHDHLDDYADMEAYYQAKRSLFTPQFTERAVISLDTEWGRRLATEAEVPCITLNWSTAEASGDWAVELLDQSLSQAHFVLQHRSSGERLEARVGLFGEQVVFDTAIALLMLHASGVSITTLREALEGRIIPWTAPGRMEVLSGEYGPVMILDYGHTPEAFSHSLRAIRSAFPGTVIMIFGVDGDRDTTKRVAMAQNAAAGSDIVIVTDYNPRFEDPDAIRQVLVQTIADQYPEVELYDIADPATAIRKGIALAGDHSLVFWAGPGHEDYREVRGKRIDYSSREDSLKALAEAGWSA